VLENARAVLSFDGKNHEIEKGDPVELPDLESIT
jgi:hypothetical protein